MATIIKYVNAQSGNDSNNGSITSPWKTLKNVANNSTVILQSGYHQAIQLLNKSNITIKGDSIVPINVVPETTTLDNYLIPMDPTKLINNGKLGAPTFDKTTLLNFKMQNRVYTRNVYCITLTDCSNITIDGVSVSLSYFVPTSTLLKPLFRGIYLSNSVNCKIINCELYSRKSMVGVTPVEYINGAAYCIVMGGSGNLFKSNNIYNCGGIQFKGRSNIADGNFITDMPTDGFGIWSGGNIAINNRIQNSRKVNNNHNDLLQCGTSNNAVIMNNVLIAYTTPDLLYKNTAVQGLGCFDGTYNLYHIKNNIILVDHPIGIWIQGGINCVVENNNVILCGTSWNRNRTPCILVGLKKDGITVSKNCIIRNNIAQHFELTCDSASKFSNNYILDTKKFYITQ
jgi:hypothetical protein